MTDRARSEPDEDTRDGFARWVLPYFEDSALWPVLIVVIAALAAFLTPILLYATIYFDLRAIAAALLLLVGTGRAVVFEWRSRGRAGGLTVSLACVWLLALAAVFYGVRSGLL